MYLNTFVNTFVNTFLYYFQTVVLFIQSLLNLKMNEMLGIKLVQIYCSYVNDITDMHVIYYITCW